MQFALILFLFGGQPQTWLKIESSGFPVLVMLMLSTHNFKLLPNAPVNLRLRRSGD